MFSTGCKGVPRTIFAFNGDLESRLALHWIDRSMDVKRRQMESSFDIARTYLEQFVSAQKSQADAFSRLATAVERRDSEDSFEHQEMLIAIKAMHQQLSALAKSEIRN